MSTPRTLRVALACVGSLLAPSTASAQVESWTQVDLLCPVPTSPGEYFGFAADLHAYVAAVGTFDRDVVYVFERPPGALAGWTEVARLAPGPASQGASFGNAVAVHGETIVVGARFAQVPGVGGAGAVHVYERAASGPGAWGEVARLTASDAVAGDLFGTSVAVHGDTVVVGAYADSVYTGDAYVYERDAGGLGAWGEVARLTPSNGASGSWYGTGVAVFEDTIAVGAEFDDHPGVANVGSAYVYERNAGGPDAWGEVAVLESNNPATLDSFGCAVALFEDRVLVGAKGASSSGAAYVFERDHGGANAWGLAGELLPSDGASGDLFGNSVDVFGDRALVGAHRHDIPGEIWVGAAYVYTRDHGGPGAWGEAAKLTVPNPFEQDLYGAAVALSGPSALVSRPGKSTGYPVQSWVEGAAFDPVAGRLYATDFDVLLDVDPGIGLSQAIGAIGFTWVQGLAYDANAGRLFGSSVATDQLMVIDTATGAGSVVGALGWDRVEGLAFDPVSDRLYGVDTTSGQLLMVDTATGAGTAVGPIGFAEVRALAYDPGAGVLYGADVATAQLLTIDTLTGAGTAVGATGLPPVFALTFDPQGQVLYGIRSQGIVPQLMTLDTATGAGTVVGYLMQPFTGTAHVLELEPVAYCTAGTSSSGCAAAVSSAGRASATAPAGLVLTVSAVEGNKNGFLFFGTNGRQAAPWGNGSSYQCVIPPVKRGGLLSGTGTNGQCNGSFSQDLNALWSSAPAKNPGAGATVQLQLWYRDPVNTSNQTTSLSDAIEFTVGP